MGIVVDIILILIIVGNAIIGYKMGLTKVVFSIFSSIVAIVLVFILYKPVTNLVYNHTEIAPKLENLITEEVLQNASNSLVTYATNKVSYNIISGIVYIALFAVIRIVLEIVEKSVDFLANLPFIKTVNSSGGMIYGIIRGFFTVYVVLAILSFMVPVLGDNVIISSINNAYIGSKMFNHNILLNAIFKFLLILVILLVFAFGSFMGYSITKNGGGLQGLIATLLGQDIENLQKNKELDTINVLLLRN